jgi:hypothetical protein
MKTESKTTRRSNAATLFNAIAGDARVAGYLTLADAHMAAIGYTEHGVRHAQRVATGAALILRELGHAGGDAELARVAGYLHDIGNFVCRTNHGQTAAILLNPILAEYITGPYEVGLVLSAIGNHEEEYGQVYNYVCAAVMIADKADVHRSRVRAYDPDKHDIHDQVNYAVTRSQLIVDADKHEIRLELEIDDAIATVMDYFEIFLARMVMCRNAAAFLGCKFRIVANHTELS